MARTPTPHLAQTSSCDGHSERAQSDNGALSDKELDDEEPYDGEPDDGEPDDGEPDDEDQDDGEPGDDVDDPTVITGPVVRLVHPNLANAWEVYKDRKMCWIFDFVTPARQWKRGTKYTQKNPWATYSDLQPDGDITESDAKKYRQKPYFPLKYE